MEFFNFELGEDNSEEFVISKHFWIYWAITVPLSLFTLGLWFVWDRRASAKKEFKPN